VGGNSRIRGRVYNHHDVGLAMIHRDKDGFFIIIRLWPRIFLSLHIWPKEA
jgi:hypothetical protein